MKSGGSTEGVDLSVILTAHDETLVCGPTVTSADSAIRAAQDAGITVERIIALDRPTLAAKQWFSQHALADWSCLEFDEGDLGRVRNAVLPHSRGKFVAFLDADDLFSENWLRDGVMMLRDAATAGKRAIAHPELNWLFDGAHSVYLKPAQDEVLFTPWHFYAMNYYDSLCLCPREAHLEHPYVHRDIPNGLSYQDWQFSIETMAGGWEHLSVPDTIIFKRRRDVSLVNESRNRRALVRQLDPMAIDKVASLGGTVPRQDADPDAEALAFPVQVAADFSSRAHRFFRGAATETPSKKMDDVPHYGAVFGKLVSDATARKGYIPRSMRRHYDLVAENLDVPFYLASNPDIRELGDMDPVAHYMRAGWKEGRDPAPWFTTRLYLERYPDVAQRGENPFVHWLTTGWTNGYTPIFIRDLDTVAEILGLTPEQTVAAWRARYADLQERFTHGALGAQVKAAAEHEPLVELAWMEAIQVKLPPLHSNVVSARTASVWRLSQAANMRRARHVICVNRARFGGAARIEGHLARSLAARDGAESVVVITTDRAGQMPKGKLPEGVRHVDFAELTPKASQIERERILAEFLRSLNPEAVFNVNSRLLWDALTPYGKALAASMHIYACLLCPEQTLLGHWTGYPLRRFYRHFDQLTGIITDSHRLVQDLRSQYLLPEDWSKKLRVLPNPVASSIPIARPAENPKPRIFWAGRLDRQKRPDLLRAIVAALPEVDFHVWGEKVMDAEGLPDPLPSNLTVHAPYLRFADLPMEEADVWLYTSAWDGVPTMLLEVAMTGVPLIGSDVGGTTEVLRSGLATAMPKDAEVKDWVAAIRSLLSDPVTARENAKRLRETLLAERSSEEHARALDAFLKDTAQMRHEPPRNDPVEGPLP